MILEKIDGPKNIFLSGGADSAILLYLLLKQQPDTLTTALTWVKKNTYYKNLSAIKVMNWCINETNNNNVVHIIKYADTQYEGCLNELGRDYRDNNPICFGITSFPKENVEFGLPELSDNDFRTQEGKKDVWQRNKYCPFINHDKKYIAELYNTYKLEDLFELTNSCESTETIKGHCGGCWWCKERFWAFNKY